MSVSTRTSNRVRRYDPLHQRWVPGSREGGLSSRESSCMSSDFDGESEYTPSPLRSRSRSVTGSPAPSTSSSSTRWWRKGKQTRPPKQLRKKVSPSYSRRSSRLSSVISDLSDLNDATASLSLRLNLRSLSTDTSSSSAISTGDIAIPQVSRRAEKAKLAFKGVIVDQPAYGELGKRLRAVDYKEDIPVPIPRLTIGDGLAVAPAPGLYPCAPFDLMRLSPNASTLYQSPQSPGSPPPLSWTEIKEQSEAQLLQSLTQILGRPKSVSPPSVHLEEDCEAGERTMRAASAATEQSDDSLILLVTRAGVSFSSVPGGIESVDEDGGSSDATIMEDESTPARVEVNKGHHEVFIEQELEEDLHRAETRNSRVPPRGGEPKEMEVDKDPETSMGEPVATSDSNTTANSVDSTPTSSPSTSITIPESPPFGPLFLGDFIDNSDEDEKALLREFVRDLSPSPCTIKYSGTFESNLPPPSPGLLPAQTPALGVQQLTAILRALSPLSKLSCYAIKFAQVGIKDGREMNWLFEAGMEVGDGVYQDLLEVGVPLFEVMLFTRSTQKLRKKLTELDRMEEEREEGMEEIR